MANFTTNLTVTTPNETVSATKSGNYDVVVMFLLYLLKQGRQQEQIH